MAPTTDRASTGKLKKVVKKRNNDETAAGRRQLQGPKRGLRDPYVEPFESLELPSITLEKPHDPSQEFSPMRKEKRQQKTTAASRLSERRQTRSSLAVPNAEATEQSSPKTPRRSPRNQQTEEGLFVSPTSGDRLLANGESGRRGRKNETVGDDVDEQAKAQSDARPSTTPAKRGPGRPRKSNPDSAQPPSATMKRGRGRPSKAKQAVIEAAEQDPEQPETEDQAVFEVPHEETHASGSERRFLGATQAGKGLQPKPKPVQIRKSQVHFPDAEGRDALEESAVDVVQTPQGRPRKRKAPSGSSQAGPSKPAKRPKPAQQSSNNAAADETDQESEEETDEEEEQLTENGEAGEDEQPIDRHRLFGVGWRLEAIYSGLERTGSQAHIMRDDEDVRAIIRLCNQAKSELTRLQDEEEENGEPIPDPPKQFDEIARTVRKLCGNDENAPTDFNNRDKCAQIYFHVIPRLVKLLQHTVEAYETKDGRDGHSSITEAHHQSIIDLIEVILTMGNGARIYKRPRGYAVIKPVRSDVIPPLRRVQAELSRVLWRREQAPILARRRAFQAAEDARRLEEDEQEQEQIKREQRLRALWWQLHEERRNVEGMVGRKKSFHLRMLDAAIEFDQNGELFERISMFRRRIGPHPAYVEKARDHVWDLKEIDALHRGLRRYIGPGVFRDIFREHCRHNGVLTKYNVTEIVTTAADFKDHLEETQMKEKGTVEDWVRKIPVWTNPHDMLGQENAA